jgi:hypothetical protein
MEVLLVDLMRFYNRGIVEPASDETSRAWIAEDVEALRNGIREFRKQARTWT